MVDNCAATFHEVKSKREKKKEASAYLSVFSIFFVAICIDILMVVSFLHLQLTYVILVY